MIKLDTNYLKVNKTPTVCGGQNYALSDEKVVDFIDKYFGGIIFVDDQEEPAEVRAYVTGNMSEDELGNYKKEYDYLEDILCDYSLDDKNDVFIGFVFSFLVGDANGSLRYEEDYLDEEGRLFFESE